MTSAVVKHLTVRRDACPVVDDASFEIGPGECVALLGPNGAGKTTLMRAALGFLPFEGTSSLADLDAGTRARACAWLPQAREIAWPLPVERIVTLGRLPHATPGTDIVDQSMARMGLQQHRTRPASELSGGEQARVLIARALAQDTPLLMVDEPIAGLDPAAQIATMRVFAELAEAGRGILVSLHDLGLAVRHCTRAIVMFEGRIVADAAPRDVLTPDTLATVFGITAHFAETHQGPLFQPLNVLP